ncbi:hypothetical protein X744_03180 [Mesorhizobium sp. LNJC372A00]|nr:hypothetical protein X744_03180 [Mesorhizobium sp. LNJC372A00]
MLILAPTFVISPKWRIRADNQKVIGCRETLVPGACREDRDVASLQRQRSSFLAPKPDFSISAGNAQNLVYLRMIVNVIIDAVSPAIAPSVCIEKHLHDGCWIKSFGQFDGASINDERPCWMIGYKSIILEPELIRLSLPHKSGDSLLARSCETGDVLDHFLAGFQNAHRRCL